MVTTRLLSNGKLQIPESLRDAHGWTEGAEFSVEEMGNTLVLRPIKSRKRKTVNEVFGSANYKGPIVSLEKMEASIRKGALESAGFLTEPYDND